MSEEKTKSSIVYGIIILIIAIIISFVAGYSLVDERDCVIIKVNGTLSLYDDIRMWDFNYFSSMFSDDLEGVYKTENKDYVIFLWTTKSRFDDNNQYLNMVVLKK